MKKKVVKKKGFKCRVTEAGIRRYYEWMEKKGVPIFARIYKDKDTGLMMREFTYADGYMSVSLL